MTGSKINRVETGLNQRGGLALVACGIVWVLAKALETRG